MKKITANKYKCLQVESRRKGTICNSLKLNWCTQYSTFPLFFRFPLAWFQASNFLCRDFWSDGNFISINRAVQKVCGHSWAPRTAENNPVMFAATKKIPLEERNVTFHYILSWNTKHVKPTVASVYWMKRNQHTTPTLMNSSCWNTLWLKLNKSMYLCLLEM